MLSSRLVGMLLSSACDPGHGGRPFYPLRIRNILVPQDEQTPCVAGLESLRATCFGQLISFIALHLKQYASIKTSGLERWAILRPGRRKTQG